MFFGEYLLVEHMDHNFAAGTSKEKSFGTSDTALLF